MPLQLLTCSSALLRRIGLKKIKKCKTNTYGNVKFTGVQPNTTGVHASRCHRLFGPLHPPLPRHSNNYNNNKQLNHQLRWVSPASQTRQRIIHSCLSYTRSTCAGLKSNSSSSFSLKGEKKRRLEVSQLNHSHYRQVFREDTGIGASFS